MKLEGINFNLFKCKMLKEVSKKIDENWNVRALKTTTGELRYLLRTIIGKSTASEWDTIKIFYNIVHVNIILKEEYNLELVEFIEKYGDILLNNDKIRDLSLLDYIYDDLLIFYNKVKFQDTIIAFVDKLLKGVQLDLIGTRGEILLDIKEKKSNIVDYFTNIFFERFNYYCEDFFRFESEYYIGENTTLFYDIVKYGIQKRIGVILLRGSVKSNIIIRNIFTDQIKGFSERVSIYKRIIDTYIDLRHFNINTDIWFSLILEKIGKPSHKNWNEFSEEERMYFRKWYNMSRLDDYFGKKVGDPERTEFWKKYAYCMLNIDYYEGYAQAIIMEFERNIVIEFGIVGNAAYVYNKEDFNFDLLDLYIRTLSPSEVISKMKNNDKAIGLNDKNKTKRWNHNGSWQYYFQSRLNFLGYKMEEV